MVSMCRYLNAADYFGGIDQEDLNQLFHALQLNFKAWIAGFAPLAVGADIDSMAVQEFSRKLFNIRPDIAFRVAKTIFTSDMRSILPQVPSYPLHFGLNCMLRSNSFSIENMYPAVSRCQTFLCEIAHHNSGLTHLRSKFLATFSKAPRIWQFPLLLQRICTMLYCSWGSYDRGNFSIRGPLTSAQCPRCRGSRPETAPSL